MTGRITGIRVIKTLRNDDLAKNHGIPERKGLPGQVSPAENRMGRVFLLIDCSGSMAGNKIEQAKRGVVEFAREAIGKEYIVGMVKFDSSAALLCEPTHDIRDLSAYLDKLAAQGSTNMAAAISAAHQNLRDVSCQRVMVIATDGRPDSTKSALQAGQAVKNEGIQIITIGTDDADLAFLRKLATQEEYGSKVAAEQFGRAIASAYLLLPQPCENPLSTLTFHDLKGNLQYSGL